jgi:acetyl esterase/lipase
MQSSVSLHRARVDRPASRSPMTSVIARDDWYSGYRAARRVRIYEDATGSGERPLAIYLHSGSVVSGDLDAGIVARRLVWRLGVTVVAPAYSLATEEPFPAAIEDAYAAMLWSASHVAAQHRIAVIGDAAGGNLAAVMAMMARDRGGPALAAQVLIAPMLDPTSSFASVRATDFSGLPPTLIVTAPGDAFRDEAKRYGEKLAAAGGKLKHLDLPTNGSEVLWYAMRAFLQPLLATAPLS